MALKTRQKTELILDEIKKDGFTPTDVEHGSNYFVFEHGKDKVVHFHIKELKGWKFGIWWDTNNKPQYDFFCQYEHGIDKFKPTASTYVVYDLRFHPSHNSSEVKWQILGILEFIKKHPYVAWAYDQGYPRDCWEYLTDFEAWKRYVAYKWQYEILATRIHEQMRKRYVKLMDKIVATKFIEGELVDRNQDGIVSSPRYDIRCSGIIGEELKPGFYIMSVSELDKKLQKEASRYMKKYKKLERRKYGFILRDIDLNGDIPFLVRRHNG